MLKHIGDVGIVAAVRNNTLSAELKNPHWQCSHTANWASWLQAGADKIYAFKIPVDSAVYMKVLQFSKFITATRRPNIYCGHYRRFGQMFHSSKLSVLVVAISAGTVRAGSMNKLLGLCLHFCLTWFVLQCLLSMLVVSWCLLVMIAFVYLRPQCLFGLSVCWWCLRFCSSLGVLYDVLMISRVYSLDIVIISHNDLDRWIWHAGPGALRVGMS